jgi:hypothetical protein
MKTTAPTVILILIVSDNREPPSSTFPAAPAIDTDGETISETTRPLAKVYPMRVARKAAG